MKGDGARHREVAGLAIEGWSPEYGAPVEAEPEALETIARAAKRAGVRFVYLAGRAGANADRQRRAGVDAYVHLGVDAVTILRGARELAKES